MFQRSRAPRRIALLTGAAVLIVPGAFASDRDAAPLLRSALPIETNPFAVEQRARALLEGTGNNDRRRGPPPLLGAAARTARDSFLPGVGAMRDGGPTERGDVRHARVRGDGPLAYSLSGADGPAAPSDNVLASMRGALRVNEGIQASLHRAEAAAHELAQARGAMMPKLTLGGEIGTDDPTKQWHEQRDGRVELSLAMPLFASGANVNALRAARAKRDVAELTVLAEERQEMLRAATAFLDVATAMKIVSALRENVRGMASTLRAAKALAASGEAGISDVALAEANLASARGELASGQQALRRARIEHQSLTGREVAGNARMPNTAQLVPDDVETIVAHAIANSPDAKAGWRNADAQRYAARAVHGSIGPSVSLTGSVGRDYRLSENRDGWEEIDAAVGVRFSMPLVDAEALPRVRGARAMARAAEWDARDTARTIERRVRTAHAVHVSAVERQGHAEGRVRAIERALGATRAEYGAGFLAITDVTRAQIELARARIELAKLERERHRAAYTLALVASIPIGT